MLLYPGQSLIRSADRSTLAELGGHLIDLSQDLEQQNDPLLRAIRVWWDWYEARPRTKEKNVPFRKASNVVVPLIGIMADAMTSQSLASFTSAGDRFWQSRVENEGNEVLAQNMIRYVNWQARNDFPWISALTGWLQEVYVLGEGVFALHYRKEVRPLFYGPGQTTSERLKYKMIEMLRGPQVEPVPRESILWDTEYPVHEAPMVVRVRQWTWSELNAMAQMDPSWDRQNLDEIRGLSGTDDYPSWESIRQSKSQRQGREDPQRDVRSPHLVYELHVDWPMLGGRFALEEPGQESKRAVHLPLMIHLHRKTGRILRIVAEPYHIPGKPFLAESFRRGSPGGVAKKLEQLQSIQTTLYNQAIDAQTRANAIWAKTRNPKFLTEPFDPSRPIHVGQMDEFETLNVGTSIQPNLNLLVAAQTMAERWMGPADPLLGRETRSGGHPSPATSTLALLEQAQKMSAFTDINLHQAVARVGQWVAILDQQFETNADGKLQRVLGASDALTIGEFMFPTDPIPGNYLFEVTSLSRTDNPDVQMRRALLESQAHNNYWGFVLAAAQALDNPQVGPRVKTFYAKAIDSMGRIYNHFLDAANVDDMERFLGELSEVGIDVRNAFQQFVGEAQNLAAAQAGPDGVGAVASGPGTVPAAGSVGPVEGAPNGGAGRPFAGIGLLE